MSQESSANPACPIDEYHLDKDVIESAKQLIVRK